MTDTAYFLAAAADFGERICLATRTPTAPDPLPLSPSVVERVRGRERT